MSLTRASTLCWRLAQTGTKAGSGVHQLLQRQVQQQQKAVRLYSGSGKKDESFIQKNFLNVVVMPICVVILFTVLPTFRTGEIHSLDYYDKLYLEQTKAKEAAKAAAAAAAEGSA